MRTIQRKNGQYVGSYESGDIMFMQCRIFYEAHLSS